jgi:hypothetical protein
VAAAWHFLALNGQTCIPLFHCGFTAAKNSANGDTLVAVAGAHSSLHALNQDHAYLLPLWLHCQLECSMLSVGTSVAAVFVRHCTHSTETRHAYLLPHGFASASYGMMHWWQWLDAWAHQQEVQDELVVADCTSPCRDSSAAMVTHSWR